MHPKRPPPGSSKINLEIDLGEPRRNFVTPARVLYLPGDALLLPALKMTHEIFFWSVILSHPVYKRSSFRKRSNSCHGASL